MKQKKEKQKKEVTRDEFFSQVMKTLIRLREESPESYGAGPDERSRVDLIRVYQRYVTNLTDGAYGRFSPLIRQVCTDLGVRPDRSVISEILSRSAGSDSGGLNPDGGNENETKKGIES